VKTGLIALILLIFSNLAYAQSIVREPVEEVVAVVDRTPILRSDIDLALLLGLGGSQSGSDEEATRSALLDLRILLEVQFRDLEASGVLYRLDLDVTKTRRRLLAAAGGAAIVEAKLGRLGLGDADLDELALRLGAVNAYAEQRLRPRVTVGIQEIETAYRELVAELVARGEPVPELTAVHDRLHRVLVERKLNDEIQRWTARAFEEREVTRFVR
jgi:hypothetical protein